MSKHSSTSLPKNCVNTNTNPTYTPGAYHWPTSFMPPVGQLALTSSTPPPGLWTPIGAPITAGYGYGYPYGQQMSRFGPPPIAPHQCCVANQRHQFGAYDHNCNGWPSAMCWSNKVENEALNARSNGVAITEVDSRTGSDDDSTAESTNGSTHETKNKLKINRRKVKEMEKTNKDLLNSLAETRRLLKRTQETLLKKNEKMSFDCIETYRQNLKKFGDFIRQELNRFCHNDEMTQKLKPIVQQITIASNHIKEEKERIRQSVRTIQLAIDEDRDIDWNVLNLNPLPEFPVLLGFYKSILDEIPLIFLSDLSQLKRLANNFIQTNNKLSNSVTNSLSIGLSSLPLSSFGDGSNSSMKPLPSVSSAIYAPNISDLPKPDFNTLPLKSGPVEPSPTALELNFPRTSSPVSLPDSIDETMAATTILDIIPLNKTKEKPISPIGKPVPPVIDLKAICAENVKNNQNNSLSEIGESVLQCELKLETDSIRPPFNPIPIFSKQMALKANNNNNTVIEPTVGAVEVPKPPLNQAQSRLLVKLKEKYPQMSDLHLIDSMVQTKAILIASGVPKGFSGMKVADIVDKISDYIESKVLSNNFSKPRLTDLNAKQSSIDKKQMIDSIGRNGSKKTWNILNQKSCIADDSICSVCFESISMVDKYETECQHFFHRSCIISWIRTHGSCPICRHRVLPPEEYPEL